MTLSQNDSSFIYSPSLLGELVKKNFKTELRPILFFIFFNFIFLPAILMLLRRLLVRIFTLLSLRLPFILTFKTWFVANIVISIYPPLYSKFVNFKFSYLVFKNLEWQIVYPWIITGRC